MRAWRQEGGAGRNTDANCPEAIEIDAALFKTEHHQGPLNARISARESYDELTIPLPASSSFTASLPCRHRPTPRPQVSAHVIVIDGTLFGCLDYQELLVKAAPIASTVQVDMDDIYCWSTPREHQVLKAAMLTHRNWLCLTRDHSCELEWGQ